MSNQEAIEKLSEVSCLTCVVKGRSNMENCKLNCTARAAIIQLIKAINDYEEMQTAYHNIVHYDTKEARDKARLMNRFDEMVKHTSGMSENQKTAYIETLGKILG